MAEREQGEGQGQQGGEEGTQHQLRILYNVDTGNVQLAGPVEDPVLCYGMLLAALESFFQEHMLGTLRALGQQQKVHPASQRELDDMGIDPRRLTLEK